MTKDEMIRRYADQVSDLRTELGRFKTLCDVSAKALADAQQRISELTAALAESKAGWALTTKLLAESDDECDRLEAALAEEKADKEDGIGLLTTERRRQIEHEGWHAAHDDDHDFGELESAAETYLTCTRAGARPILRSDGAPVGWPWDGKWWKPSPDRIRNLVKAGALIAAEIDRLIRAARNAAPR